LTHVCIHWIITIAYYVNVTFLFIFSLKSFSGNTHWDTMINGYFNVESEI